MDYNMFIQQTVLNLTNFIMLQTSFTFNGICTPNALLEDIKGDLTRV